MPILSMSMGKCPGNASNVKPAGYPGILIDVTRIVIVNEVVPERLAEDEPRKHGKKNANTDSYRPTACFGESDCFRINMVHVRALK